MAKNLASILISALLISVAVPVSATSEAKSTVLISSTQTNSVPTVVSKNEGTQEQVLKDVTIVRNLPARAQFRTNVGSAISFFLVALALAWTGLVFLVRSSKDFTGVGVRRHD